MGFVHFRIKVALGWVSGGFKFRAGAGLGWV